jgi:hypothetical protein
MATTTLEYYKREPLWGAERGSPSFGGVPSQLVLEKRFVITSDDEDSLKEVLRLLQNELGDTKPFPQVFREMKVTF